MKLSISNADKEKIFGDLKVANNCFESIYPGDSSDRQPIHTVYGGADLFRYDIAQKFSAKAAEIFETYAPDVSTFGKVFSLEGEISERVYEKVQKKLKSEALEDFRIDFEDGYGNRSNQEEDQTAVNAAKELAKGIREKSLPPFIGIRIKPFTEEMKDRGLRTFDIFVTTLIQESGGKLPSNFVVMLPKVTIVEQVSSLVRFFEIVEDRLKLDQGSLKMEMMVEATQTIMDINGMNPLSRLLKASKGRCIAMHFGTYDYTASCNITARYQEMNHPVCDFAHHMTKVALAHTGIWLSDGATNTMPIGPHRGKNLTSEQLIENREAVHQGWKKGYDHIRHSLWNGLYQGWDLNPAQIPMRYTAVFAFFLESYDEAVDRLKTFIEKSARATLIGDVFDDAATGQGLLNYFLRALNSGAITETEALNTGLTLEELRSRSFKSILEKRTK